MPNLTTSNSVDTFMQSADQSAMRTNLGLGDAATKNTGTTAGTVAAGDDSRITGAVQTSRTVSAGTGLTGGGDLSANRTLSVFFGTTSTTVAAGNDARFQNTIVAAYGPGSFTLSHPFSGSPTRVLADIYLASGGGGGGAGGVSTSTSVRGGNGGSMGVIRVIKNLSIGSRSLYAIIGNGGSGGAPYQGQSGQGENGQPGEPSTLYFNDGLFELIAQSETSDLLNTGGHGGSPSLFGPSILAGNHDATISQPWFAGWNDALGVTFPPSNIDLFNGQITPSSPFIANPLLACGGSGGGVDEFGNGHDGGEGMDLWGFGWNGGTPTTRYGKLSGNLDATAVSSFDNPDADVRIAFFNRGVGGSGGASATTSTWIEGNVRRAGNGSKGSPGCGGGGGGAHRHDGNQDVLSGTGGAGGDGFLVIIWRRAE